MPFPARQTFLFCTFCVVVLGNAQSICSGNEGQSGEQIYQQRCASCHGAKGEGDNNNYPQPLAGDRSVSELAQYIEKSMPDKDPQKCVGEDAQKVAAFIHESFYSPIAQARNKPPRIELARLTVRQYRQSLADLIGSFRGTSHRGSERGLKAEYFKSRRMRDEDRAIERIDPVVKFDFGEGSPEKEKIDPAEFSIRWQGSVFAPETGEYEFILQTENGARLWVNDNDKPLIDGNVKSGKDLELSESIRLIGGRIYLLRLETFKSKEAKEKRAAITLKWKPPHHAVEVIPQRHLVPQWSPEAFIVQTPFPPDDRSEGYERGNSISKAWEQATTDAALEVAAYLIDHSREIAGRREDGGDRQAKFKEFCLRFTARAFRRPLSDEERQFFVEKQFAESDSPETAVKRVALVTLKSPRFLFRELGHATHDPYDVASRLSFGMWDSLPDEALLKTAAEGRLATPDQVRQEAERMVNDPRTQSKVKEFFLQWLRVDHLTDITKDSQKFPEFTPAMISDLRTSLDLFLDEVLQSDTADFRQFLTSDTVYLNGPLAKFYGAELSAEADFQKVPLDSSERAGVLTHPYLMSGFAYTATSSPIHRGVFIARSVLGRALRPPPEAVAPLPPELHADLTTRERVILQTKGESCQSCHSMINPLGFTLEHFDAVGRFQKEDHGKQIDSAGGYLTRTGEQKQFTSARDLATFLTSSEETHTALATQMFHHLVKQPIRAYGIQTPDELRRLFEQHNFNIRRLVVEIVTLAALKGRDVGSDISSK